MAGSAGSIYVDLLLRDASYRQGLNRSRQNTRSWSGQVRGDVSQATSAFQAVINPVTNLTNTIGGLAGVTAGAFSVSQIITYSDTWKQLQGRLGLVTDEMMNINEVQANLTAIAERTRSPLEGIYNLYTRLAQFVPEVERAQYDLLGVTESVSAALAITGETSISSQAAMIQFTQAIGTNFEAAGQELRSLQEQAPRLTQALMRSLGDGTKSLQQLKDEGKLTRQSVLNALSGAGEEGRKLAEELAKIPPTTRQAFTALNNSFIEYIGRSEAVNAGTNALASGVKFLAENLDLAVNGVVAVATVTAAQMIPALSKSVTTFAAATQQSLAYQLSLARLAGVSSTTAKSLLVMDGVFKGLLALTGGPLGAAFLALGGAVYYLTTQQSASEKVASKYADTFSRVSEETAGAVENQEAYNAALDVKLLNDNNAALREAEASLKAVNEQLQIGAGGGFFDQFRAFGSQFSSELYEVQQAFRTGKIDIDQYGLALELLEEKYPNFNNITDDIQSQIAALRTAQIEVDNLGGSLGNLAQQQKEYGPFLPGQFRPGAKPELSEDNYKALDQAAERAQEEARKRAETASKDAAREAERQQKALEDSYRRNREYITGVTAEEIKRADVVKELSDLLGTEYIPNQYALNAAIQRYDESLEENAETAKLWGIDISDIGKDAANNIKDAFADFLFDPLDDGFNGMVDGFATAIRKMLAEAAAANLVEALFGNQGKGSDKTTGVLGSFLGTIAGGLFGGGGSGGNYNPAVSAPKSKPSQGGFFDGFFATGGFIQPGHFGIVGENGPELAYGGNSGKTIVPNTGMGGTTINIDARGAGPGVGEEIRRVMSEVTALKNAVPGMAVSAVSNANKRNPRFLNG